MVRVDWLVTEMNVLGGAETFICNAVPRLRKLGWDLRLITLSNGGILVDQLRAESVPVLELGLNKKNSIQVLLKLLTLWRKEKPRILHTHLYHAGIIGRLLGKISGIQTIFVHQAGPELFRNRVRSFFDRYTASLVTQYVVTGEFVRQILQNREQVKPQKISIIPNGIDTHQFDLPRTRPEDWPAMAQSPVLGTVGRLSPEKGHFFFLEALAILHQNGADFQAIMIGDGALKEELLQKTRILHLEERLFWVGAQTNIPDWLSLLDVFVLPSQWEGISLALLEAMAAGVPVVATSVGGTPEVLTNGVNGLLVPPSDTEALAAAIFKLLENPLLCKELGQSGKIHCQNNYDIDLIVKKIDSLYRRYAL
jgi:glycosyltransferase involved in cell wall biosynthesis